MVSPAHSIDNNKQQVLKWCRSKGCPWDEDVCAFAAEEGHMDVLKWAVENGCPWDKRVR
ncbi:unnamed protein product, partial [Hapterophycus canaliculatus]